MIENEQLMGLAEAAATLPKTSGKKVSTSSLWRWIVIGRDGIRLDGVKLGGRYFTSSEACMRFAKALTAKVINEANNRPNTQLIRHKSNLRPSTIAKRQLRAEKVLDAAGV